MIRLLIALPLLVALPQEDAAIQALIRKLDDADLEVREKAVRDLIQTGARALEPLRKALTSESAEVRARAAQAIRSIEHEVRSREVCPAYKPLALKRAGTVAEVLEDLSRLAGARFDASPDLRAMKAGPVEAATLFQALDQMCAGSDPISYTVGDDGTIRLTAERQEPRPVSYFEAFKVFVTESQVLRKADAKGTTVTGRVSVHAVWEGHLKPLRRVRYEFEPAKDDAGRALEIVSAGQMDMLRLGGGAGVWIAGAFGEETDLSGPQAFELKGLVPEAKSVAVLRGSMKVSFPLARVDVAFDEPKKGDQQTSGDISIRIKAVSTGKNRISIAFSKSKGDVSALKDEVLGRLDGASIRAVDENGKEHVGEMTASQDDPGMGGMVVIGGPGGSEPQRTVTLFAHFQSLEGKDFKRFTFKFSDALFEKSVPFEIKDIKLP
jgi:hypothetical protein